MHDVISLILSATVQLEVFFICGCKFIVSPLMIDYNRSLLPRVTDDRKYLFSRIIGKLYFYKHIFHNIRFHEEIKRYLDTPLIDLEK